MYTHNGLFFHLIYIDYGLNVDSPDQAPRGPYFAQEPEDTVILGQTGAVHFDCVANGLPAPEYEWRYAQLDTEKLVKLIPTDR